MSPCRIASITVYHPDAHEERFDGRAPADVLAPIPPSVEDESLVLGIQGVGGHVNKAPAVSADLRAAARRRSRHPAIQGSRLLSAGRTMETGKRTQKRLNQGEGDLTLTGSAIPTP